MAGGRIPDSFIQELLARTDIVELIGSRVELKRAGREYKGLSPFTHEKTPSFFVSPAKQMFFDFSSGKNGNAISFLMDYERLAFPEAVEELARRAGLTVPREDGHAPAPSLEGPLQALAQAVRLYRAELRRAPQAIDYLKGRGLSGETAQRFGIGYAPDEWEFLARRLQSTADALTAGLVKRKDGTDRVYDVFRNRIMFPIHDARGRVIAFGGRTLGDDPAKYLNSPETPLFRKGRNLFGLYQARQAGSGAPPYLLVVEGYMDAVMLAQFGFPNTVATLGTATTREQLLQLFKTTERVVFCFDGDAAGRRAAWRALEQALSELQAGRECRFMFLPEGQDPDTLVQAEGAQGFARRVEAALPLSEFLLGELARQADPTTLDGRARLLERAAPFVAKLREGPLRTLLVQELAQRARLPVNECEALLAAPQRRLPPPAPSNTAGSRLVRRLVQLLLERPALAARVEQPAALAEAPMPGVGALIEALEFFAEHPDLSASHLLERWRGTAKAAALQRLPAAEGIDDEQAVAAEFASGVERVQLAARRARLHRLLEQASTRDQPSSELAALVREIQRQLSPSSLV